MTISLKHAFTSAKSDGGDATFVQPSNWNAEHAITMATSKLLGRQTAATGAVEEIAITTLGFSIINAADLAALLVVLGAGAFTTGDLKETIKITADAGWVMANDGTIGNASSSASTRANADTSALFTLIFNNCSDTAAPLLTSAGAATTRVAQTNAATAYAANCRITLPAMRGRARVGIGQGAGLVNNWGMGVITGEETHQLTTAELASHSHVNTLTDPGHAHSYNGGTSTVGVQSGGVTAGGQGTGQTTGSVGTGITITNVAAGSNTAHNNLQPSVGIGIMIKL